MNKQSDMVYLDAVNDAIRQRMLELYAKIESLEDECERLRSLVKVPRVKRATSAFKRQQQLTSL